MSPGVTAGRPLTLAVLPDFAAPQAMNATTPATPEEVLALAKRGPPSES